VGKQLQTIVDEAQEPGSYSYDFSAKQLGYAHGVYIVKLKVGGKEMVRKLIEY